MLEQLEDKFKDERNTLEKEEMQAKHAFEMQVDAECVGNFEGGLKGGKGVLESVEYVKAFKISAVY